MRSIILTLIVVLGVTFLLDFGYARYGLNKASHLLSDVEKLQVGVSSTDEIRNLSARYKGQFRDTSLPDPSYLLAVTSPFVIIHNEPIAIPGQRLWSVAVYLFVRDNKLSTIRIVAGVRRSDRLVMAADISVTNDSKSQHPARFDHANQDTGADTDVVSESISSYSSSDQIHQAFKVNLSCMTRLFECRNVCEILPSAWKELPIEKRVRYHNAFGEEIGAECEAAVAH